MKNALLGTTAGTPIEVWFQDEARVGQKGSLTYVWAPIGSCPLMVRDNRHDSAYLFGAICPARAVGAAIIMPAANTEAMNEHLNEISTQVAPGAHAVVVCDRAGWHQTGGRLRVPDNITLLPLPSYAPELNPMENVWEYLRGNKLSRLVWDCYDAIITACKKDGNSSSRTQTGSDQSGIETGHASMFRRIGITIDPAGRRRPVTPSHHRNDSRSSKVAAWYVFA
jgi:hypothetical protein